MAEKNILASVPGTPMRERPTNELTRLWDAIQSYANRTGEHFMGGMEQNAQGFGDIYERGAVHTGIPRMAFGGLASLGAPVSAALEPILSPYLAPAMSKMNEYVGKPIEAATGYPADLANEIALLPLGALGKVAKHAVPRLASMGDAIGGFIGPDMPLAGAVRGAGPSPLGKGLAELMDEAGSNKELSALKARLDAEAAQVGGAPNTTSRGAALDSLINQDTPLSSAVRGSGPMTGKPREVVTQSYKETLPDGTERWVPGTMRANPTTAPRFEPSMSIADIKRYIDQYGEPPKPRARGEVVTGKRMDVYPDGTVVPVPGLLRMRRPKK